MKAQNNEDYENSVKLIHVFGWFRRIVAQGFDLSFLVIILKWFPWYVDYFESLFWCLISKVKPKCNMNSQIEKLISVHCDND